MKIINSAVLLSVVLLLLISCEKTTDSLHSENSESLVVNLSPGERIEETVKIESLNLREDFVVEKLERVIIDNGSGDNALFALIQFKTGKKAQVIGVPIGNSNNKSVADDKYFLIEDATITENGDQLDKVSYSSVDSDEEPTLLLDNIYDGSNLVSQVHYDSEISIISDSDTDGPSARGPDVNNDGNVGFFECEDYFRESCGSDAECANLCNAVDYGGIITGNGPLCSASIAAVCLYLSWKY